MRALNYIELDTSSSSRTSVYSIPILPAMKSSPRSRSRIQRGLSLWPDPRIRHSRETSASRSPSFRRRISPWASRGRENVPSSAPSTRGRLAPIVSSQVSYTVLQLQKYGPADMPLLQRTQNAAANLYSSPDTNGSGRRIIKRSRL
jgi:hypothetical protein